MFEFTLPYPEAVKLAKKLMHSVSTEETRYYLNGFFMHKAADGKHYAVSTNGHMLTRLEVSPAYKAGEFPAAIFPTEAIKQIKQLKVEKGLRDKTDVTFRVGTEALTRSYQLECRGTLLGGKLIDGTYPDYQRVIPPNWREYPNTYNGVGFRASYLAAIMEAASYDEHAFANKHGAVRLHFDGTNAAVVTEVSDPKMLYVIMPTRV